MAIPVVEFSREGYKIRKVFGLKLMPSMKNQQNYQSLYPSEPFTGASVAFKT
jgi:hypothetical protein